ncbi:uncharacterized protein LOC132405264 [Hypanus sabinus]|uniref:uncharacterized protein LOC132405264 n=2 Tax=Hypanus sabinus TaxID=79690 RepID=UPI0028C4732F|nr:uncharacterized protein LOC132405264 [Hypanus sabinus]
MQQRVATVIKSIWERSSHRLSGQSQTGDLKALTLRGFCEERLQSGGTKERKAQDWDILKTAASYDDHIDIEEYAEAVISYTAKSTEDITVMKTFTARGYKKPWMTTEFTDTATTCFYRWLSRRKVLKRFVACLEEVKTFLGSKGLTFPELEQPEWLEKLHFMVDMTAHLNTLNTALQGKGRTALHMLEDVLAFERKLTVLARDLQKGTLSHFPNLREFKQGHDMIISEYLHSAIIAMQTSFGKRFCEFREEKNTLSFPVTPLSIDPSLLNTTALAGVSQPDLEMELADIADKDIWVSKFRRLTADLEDVARQKAVLAQKHKWSDIENLTDDSLRSCVKMKVTSYSPDVQTLCAEVQEQKSH